MQQLTLGAPLVRQLDALRAMFDPVLLVDAGAAVLDPETLAPTGACMPPVPALDAQGRGWRAAAPAADPDALALYLYRRIETAAQPLFVVLGCTLPAGGAPQPDAFRRLLEQCRDEMYHDPATGIFNRRYLLEEYPARAAALLAAGLPLSAAAVRVNEYPALCAGAGEAADRCLNIAAGLLQTALDPAWQDAVLVRWADGVFLAVAAVDAGTLRARLQTALDGGRRSFALSLSRRGAFTAAVAAAGADEAGGWEGLPALALERLAAL